MSSSLPRLVRLYCGLSRRLLPHDLWAEHGRDINEAFYDLYVEADRAPDTLERVRLLGRELLSLFSTAIDERRAARRHRNDNLALRARPRTPGRGPEPQPNHPLAGIANMLDTLLNDIRYALRTLRKSPVFTVVAIATLALGIGANAAVFSVVNTVLLQPLPYDEPENLYVVWTNFGRDLPQNWISGPEYLEIRDYNTSLEDFAIYTSAAWSMTSAGSEPARVGGAAVSGSFFDLLRVSAAQGRVINSDDDNNGQRVATISHGFWQTRLGGRANVVGGSLTLNGADFEIVGVLPEDFRVHHPNIAVPETVGLFVPYQPAYDAEYATMSRGSHFLLGFARARSGTSPAQVQADMDNVALKMNETGNYSFDGWGLTSYQLLDDLVEPVEAALVVLLGAVGFVLLIACFNVANLQLTRASQRAREIALRTAVGAGRGRLLRQLLTEAAVLGAAGAIAGLALAAWMIATLEAIAPEGLPRAASIGLDSTVLAFAAAATVATVAIFGVLPGFLATRTNLSDALRDSGRTTSAGPGGSRVRSMLVVAEVAAALILLVGAGLLLRSFTSLINTDPGYRTESTLTLRVSLPSSKYDQTTSALFHSELLERTRALPGVISAGAISAMPLSNFGGSGSTLAERTEAEDMETFGGYAYIEADRRAASEGYFETMGVELVAGRLFAPSDTVDSLPVAIVDESFARRFWGNDNPLGERVSFNFSSAGPGNPINVVWSEVVGVIRHARSRNLAADGREQIYVPAAQMSMFGMHLAIRTDGDPTQVASAVNGIVWDLDPDQPVSDIATMRERVETVVAGQRFVSLLLGSFAAAAVILAAIGIYGVIAYSVGQRTNEIGVRMALGASHGKVRHMVLREGMGVVLIGVGLGLTTALGLARLLTSMLYEVTTTDPITYLGVVMLLVMVAASACLIPALRATRVEPVTALRDD